MEGAPEEVKVSLGWELNPRSLVVKLPEHKHKAWSLQVQKFISSKTANADNLRSVIGCTEDIAIMIPMFGHFLDNMHQLEIKASITKKKQTIIKRAEDD